MKRSAILIFLVTIGTEVSSDECTSQVVEYIEGVLLPITSEKYVSEDKVIWAKTEATRVIELRENMLDCDVARRISLMTQVSNSSVTKNNLEIEKLEGPNLNNQTKGGSQKKHLYRY